MNLLPEAEIRKRFCPLVMGNCRGSDCAMLRCSKLTDPHSGENLKFCGVGGQAGAWAIDMRARGSSAPARKSVNAQIEEMVASIPEAERAEAQAAFAGLPNTKLARKLARALIKASIESSTPSGNETADAIRAAHNRGPVTLEDRTRPEWHTEKAAAVEVEPPRPHDDDII